MICQYCGKPLQSITAGDVCTNPACPGRLRRESVTELKPCPFCGSIPEVYDSETDDLQEEGSYWVSVCCRKCGAEPFRHIYSDNANENTKQAYRDKCISKWNTRTPAPADMERALDDYASLKIAQHSHFSKGLYEMANVYELKAEALKSRILASLTNTTPYLSEDVKGWLPIETAPKDGTRVKLLTQGGKEDIGYWSNYPRYNPDDLPGEWSTDFGNCDTPITHWMPLPEPPDRKAGE